MGIAEWGYKEREKNFDLTLSSRDIFDIKKEFMRVFKRFKNNTNFDDITLKIVIKYHENDDFL